MLYKIFRHNGLNRTGGFQTITSNLLEAINIIGDSTTNHVRLRFVNAWICNHCKQVNYNNTHQCGYCGRLNATPGNE